MRQCAYGPSMNYEQAEKIAEILKALAHPVRVLIVEALTEGDRCVGELNELADIDQSGISRHLAILKTVGILTDRREGMRVFYHLESPCLLRAFECALVVIRSEAERKGILFAEPRNGRDDGYPSDGCDSRPDSEVASRRGDALGSEPERKV